MVFKELIFNTFYFGQDVSDLQRTDYVTLSTLGRVWSSSKNSVLTVSTLGGCGGLQRTESQQFLLWEAVVVFKELISNSFFFWQVWCPPKT